MQQQQQQNKNGGLSFKEGLIFILVLIGFLLAEPIVMWVLL